MPDSNNIKVVPEVVEELWDQLTQMYEFFNIECAEISDAASEILGTQKGEFAKKMLQYNVFVAHNAFTFKTDIEVLRMNLHSAVNKIYDADVAASNSM